MFLLANDSPRGAVTGHISEQKEQRRRKEEWTDFGKHAKRLSQETWDSGMAMVIGLYGDEHTHMVSRSKLNQWIQGRFINIKALSSGPTLSRNLSQNPNWPWKAEWSNFALTKLKLPHLSFLHLNVSRSTRPTCWGVCRRSVNAEDMNVAWLSRPYSEMFNSGCRQSTHWTGEMVFKRKNRKLKWKTCEQYFHTHSWGLLPQSLTLGWVILQLSEVTLGPFSSSDGSFPALLG